MVFLTLFSCLLLITYLYCFSFLFSWSYDYLPSNSPLLFRTPLGLIVTTKIFIIYLSSNSPLLFKVLLGLNFPIVNFKWSQFPLRDLWVSLFLWPLSLSLSTPSSLSENYHAWVSWPTHLWSIRLLYKQIAGLQKQPFIFSVSFFHNWTCFL